MREVNQVCKMSARVSKGPPSKSGSKSSQCKKAVINVDLNFPATENHDEGTSTFSSGSNVVPDTQPAPIVVDLIDDDDVLISSPRAFAEAKDKSRRNRRQRIVEVDPAAGSSNGYNNQTKRQRLPANHQIINCEVYVNLESEAYSSKGNGVKHKEQVPLAPPPPPPPKEPAFSCPVCMGPLVEEMSTKCGHIFCKACIKLALAKQNKCPTCRKKMTMKDTIRVYLPTTN
ncbi:hypothetical protein V2J09_005031 [Rumex salicifolius]